MASQATLQDPQQICLDTLRDTDRDRYLACLLSPVEKRGVLAALYGFNAELARVRDLVREPLPGEVRLQYWRDLLEGDAHGSSQANPQAAGLLSAIETYMLPRQPLIDMIDARIFDLYDDPMESRSALEGYAGETASALIQLASVVLAGERAAASSEAAGHAGVAQAISGLLLLMPLHRHRGQLYLPLEILQAVGLDREGFIEGRDRQRISAAIEAFAGLGFDHLAKARRAMNGMALEAFPAFLPVSLASATLARARKMSSGIFDRPFQQPQWRRQLDMSIAAFRRKI